jgi:hypothetical protein
MSNRKKTTRTSAGLCDALFDEFDLLRNGNSDAKRAAAVAKLATQIINTKKLEIDAAALLKGGTNVSAVVFDGKGLRIGHAGRK